MAKEYFRYDGTRELCDLIDRAGHKAGLSRGQTFEDFLTCCVCALGSGLMEEEYLATVRKGYDNGQKGKRGIDHITQAFARLVMMMEATRQDILGDLFEGAITYGERGQFLTPDSLAELMMSLTADPDAKGEWVYDPCCGSGRLLLAYAEKNRPAELFGQDVDLRCVKMTTINLALRSLYGYVLWGNSLAREAKAGYRTGLNRFGRVVRPLVESELVQFRIQAPADGPRPHTFVDSRLGTGDDEPPFDGGPPIQKNLF